MIASQPLALPQTRAPPSCWLWSRGALSCSEPCTHDLEAWRAHKLEQLKYAQTEASGAPREHMDRTRRTGLLGTVCPRLRHEGVHCSQLLRSVRGANAWLLEHLLNFTGRSAEIGVWKGDFSHFLLRHWPRGSTHFLVDPWEIDRACGNQTADSRRDKHCTMTQQEMNQSYEGVVLKMNQQFPGRASILRQSSLAGAAMIEPRSLDHIYIDARHDYEGVRQDLASWWEKLCPGGLFGGHDFTNGWPGVLRAVTEFLLAHKKETAAFSITAEGRTSPSWLLFRTPSLCA